MIGLRELLLIGMVVLVLYGRTGVLKSRQAKTIMPWLSPVRRTTAGRVGRDRQRPRCPGDPREFPGRS